MHNIEETISHIEKLYQRVTGQQLQQTDVKHAFNPNMDPIAVLEMRAQELLTLINDPVVAQVLEPYTPAISVWENEDKILIRLDTPSVSKEDIDISIKGNLLIITGQRKNLPQEAGFMPRLVETRFGTFFRAITLPFESVTSEINSNLRDGVLEVTITKQTAQAKPRKTANGKTVN